MYKLLVFVCLICCLTCSACTQHNASAPDVTTTKQIEAPKLNGTWQITFKLGSQTLSSTVHFTQFGQQFSGEGTDDDSGKAFTIENGAIDGLQVYFQKVYTGTSANSNPIEYSGQYQASSKETKSPHISGQYTAMINGQQCFDQWEALPIANAVISNATTKEPVTPEHPPDLSGKWKIAYEYNFDTIRSTMFLEQDGEKLTGHGIDDDTTKKFVIKKGWYNYPKVAFDLQYPATDKNHATEQIFRGEVSQVKESDYQGLYLSGKTQGGGSWEAEEVR